MSHDEYYRALSEKINFTDDLQTASGGEASRISTRPIHLDLSHRWLDAYYYEIWWFDVPAPPAWCKYFKIYMAIFAFCMILDPHDVDNTIQDDVLAFVKYVNNFIKGRDKSISLFDLALCTVFQSLGRLTEHITILPSDNECTELASLVNATIVDFGLQWRCTGRQDGNHH